MGCRLRSKIFLKPKGCRQQRVTPAFTHRLAWSAVDVDGAAYPHAIANGTYTMPLYTSAVPAITLVKS